ncbi:MAG: beta-ketoacyl synthase N-terminal-like domain-containing protein [Acidimicrobiales bacterium]
MASERETKANTGSVRPPVSLCGIGAVTGYGWGHKFLVEGLLSGESAVRPAPGFSPHFDDDIGWIARISDEGDPSDGPSRFHRAVRHAAREAVHNAIDRGWRPGGVVGMIHGNVLGDVDMWRTYHQRGGLNASKREWMTLMPSTVMSEIATEFGFHGPNMGVMAMCASGVSGLITAQMWINAGICDDVLVLTSDVSGTAENCAAFAKVGVLFVDSPSLDACRPFQEGSRGFTAGEAAVGFIVSGRRNGGYANILGGAMTHDGFHAIHIAPDHEQVFRAFASAIDNAGVHPHDIAYVNAHGPGTRQCDTAEAAVFDTMFPAAEGIFSVKPLAGHCQGAAGAVELIASLYGFERGVIPAPPRVAKGHPRLLDGPTACVEGPIVKSSLGMGGHNAVMVLEGASA